MITGIVLAAGASERMRRPKALIETEGRTFLVHAVERLREGGCHAVTVVTPGKGSEAGPSIIHIAEQSDARVVINPRPESEQIDSLRLGLESIGPECEAVVVVPVDAPLFSPDTVRRLIDAYRDGEPPVVLPTHRGQRGHPTLFARPVFEELRTGDHPEGARGVITAHENELQEVAVDDPAVTRDIDTPEDLEALRGDE